jgi:hypothetical protein
MANRMTKDEKLPKSVIYRDGTRIATCMGVLSQEEFEVMSIDPIWFTFTHSDLGIFQNWIARSITAEE